jgi:hypothetical protein
LRPRFACPRRSTRIGPRLLIAALSTGWLWIWWSHDSADGHEARQGWVTILGVIAALAGALRRA